MYHLSHKKFFILAHQLMHMLRRSVASLLLVLMIIQSQSLFVENKAEVSYQMIKPKSSPDHPQIYVNYGNWTDVEDIQGEGTLQNPFLIANRTFNLDFGTGIHIANTVDYVKIQNCSIIGGNLGIFLDNVTNCILENNFIYRVMGTGMFLNETSNCVIYRNIIAECHAERAALYILGCDEINIECNYMFRNYVSYVLDLFSSSTCIISNNLFIDNENGMNIAGGREQIVQNNIVQDNRGWAGIAIHYNYGCIVQNNKITHNEKDGLYIQDTHDTLIQNNTIMHNYNHGINLQQPNFPEITGNNISNNTGDGIFINRGKNGTIRDNEVSYNQGFGISLHNWTQYFVIQNKTIFANNEGQIYQDESSLNYNNTIINEFDEPTEDNEHELKSISGFETYFMMISFIGVVYFVITRQTSNRRTKSVF